MKKVLITLMSIAMILCCGVSVFADDKSSDVTVTKAETYTWSIPTETIDAEDGTGKVEVSDCYIADGKTLYITVDSENDFNLVDETSATNKIAYQVKVGSAALTDGGTVLSVAAGTQKASADLAWSITGTITKAGTYKDTLTFKAEVK